MIERIRGNISSLFFRVPRYGDDDDDDDDGEGDYDDDDDEADDDARKE